MYIAGVLEKLETLPNETDLIKTWGVNDQERTKRRQGYVKASK